jgi:hypothetical protein
MFIIGRSPIGGIIIVAETGGGSGSTPPVVYPTSFPPSEVDISSDGTNITIPIASLPGLTAATANATTGDLRQLLQSLMFLFHQRYEEYEWSTTGKPYAFASYLLQNPNAVRKTLSPYPLWRNNFQFSFNVIYAEMNLVPEE